MKSRNCAKSIVNRLIFSSRKNCITLQLYIIFTIFKKFTYFEWPSTFVFLYKNKIWKWFWKVPWSGNDPLENLKVILLYPFIVVLITVTIREMEITFPQDLMHKWMVLTWFAWPKFGLIPKIQLVLLRYLSKISISKKLILTIWYYSSTEVLATLTTDVGRIVSKMHLVQPNGNINFLTGIRIAHVSYQSSQNMFFAWSSHFFSISLINFEEVLLEPNLSIHYT